MVLVWWVFSLVMLASCGSRQDSDRDDSTGVGPNKGSDGSGEGSSDKPSQPWSGDNGYPTGPGQGSGGTEVTGSNQSQFIYAYSEASCSTGTQISRSLAEHCWRLTNEALNRGCASQARLSRHTLECSPAPF